MYAKIAISCIAAAIIIFILVIIIPDTQSLNRGWTAFFVGMAADIVLLIVAIVFTILSVVNERTVLSWVCAAIFIIAILFIAGILIFNSSYGDGYRERKAQKEIEWAAANPEINEHTMLIHIARGNNEPIQRHLLKHGVETCDRMGTTPMMIAALSGNVDLLQWLIEHKARVDAQNILGVTALHMACGKGNAEYVHILLEHGANPNLTDNDGNTAAHDLAGKWNGDESLPILKDLCNHGADLSLKNNAGQSVTGLLPEEVLNQLNEK